MANVKKIKVKGTPYDIYDATAIHSLTKSMVTAALGYTPIQEDTNTTYSAADSVSAVSTTSAVGTSTAYARADHVHNISKATITTALGYTPPTENTTYSVVSKTANGLAPQLPNETTTTKYLRQDGTWQVPPDTDTDHMVYKSDNYDYPIAIGPHISNNYGSNNTTIILTPGYTDKIKINPSTGHLSAVTISAAAATTAAAGLMSAADKTKLENLVSGGDIEITPVDPAESAPPNVALGSAVGTSDKYARENHTHGINGSTITSALGYTPTAASNTFKADVSLISGTSYKLILTQNS